jgi:simple sugar transport system permease protein
MAESWVLILLGSTVSLGSPLVLAAMGGLLSERSGIINIALEGLMLTAACLTAVVGLATGNAWLGLAAGLGGSVVLSLLHAALTQAYRVDQIVSGMAINALAFGGTNFLRGRFIDDTRTLHLPTLHLNVYFVLAGVVPILIWVTMRHMRSGLRLLAVGEDPEKARQMGVDVTAVRYGALAMCGVLCGLSGALIVSNSGNFTDGMTAGRGFIALAALILGGWRPLAAFVACALFGLLNAIQLQLQGSALFGADLPPELWNSVPYLIMLIALASAVTQSRAPSGLGKE